MTLYELTEQYRQVREMMENEDIPEDVLRDTLEGIEGEIKLKADAIACLSRESELECDAIDAEIERLETLKASKLANAEKLNSYLKDMTIRYLQENPKEKSLQTEKFKFSIIHSKKTMVPDEKKFIEEAKKNGWNEVIKETTKVTTSVDRTKIKSLIEDLGVDFGELAYVEANTTLKIK